MKLYNILKQGKQKNIFSNEKMLITPVQLVLALILNEYYDASDR